MTPSTLAATRLRILAALGLLLAASAAIHLQFLLTSPGSSFDLGSYRLQAQSILDHQSVYAATERYPYPPVWVWITGLAAVLAPGTGEEFGLLVRIPGVLADLAIGALLFEFGRSRHGWTWGALLPAALFALNPLPPLISAAHGQFDSLVIAFLLLAVHLRDRGGAGMPQAAALALGAGIALKGFPILLLPYFALTSRPGQRLRTAALALAPLAACTVLYIAVFGYTAAMAQHVLTYRSTPGFGWSYFVFNHLLQPPLWAVAAELVLAQPGLVVFAAVVPWLLYGRDSASAVALVLAFFCATAFTMSVQYLVWGLPFFCLVLPAWSVAYTISGWLGAVGYYTAYDPRVLPSGQPWSFVLPAIGHHYGAGVTLVLLTTIAMVVHLVGRRVALPIWRPLRRDRGVAVQPEP